MDELREKQRKVDLQKMPVQQRKNISNALTGIKMPVEQRKNISQATMGIKKSDQTVKAARNRQYDNLDTSDPTQTSLTGVQWERTSTAWWLHLPYRIFGKLVHIASFIHLGDANAGAVHLEEAMRGLSARLPSGSHYDINDRQNKAVVDEAIEQIKIRHNATTTQGRVIRDTNIL